MYKIEKKTFGFHLTFSGIMDNAEMLKWKEEAQSLLQSAPSVFGVFVDMRELKPLPAEAQKTLESGQVLFKQKGMQRSVVIVASSIVKMQFKRLAQESGIYAFERYIDSASAPDWEKKGIQWITSAVDPDLGAAGQAA